MITISYWKELLPYTLHAVMDTTFYTFSLDHGP